MTELNVFTAPAAQTGTALAVTQQEVFHPVRRVSEKVDIDSLKDELYSLERASQDMYINADELELNWKGQVKYKVTDEVFNLTDTAFNQVMSYLNIPVSYAKRLQDEDPDLLAYNFNARIHDNNKTRLLRLQEIDYPTSDNLSIRAFLSDKYERYNNIDLLNTFLALNANNAGGFEIVDYNLTPDRFSFNTVTPTEIQGPRGVGDLVRTGLHCKNSETGQSVAGAEFFLFYLVCTNGMTRPTSVYANNRRHIGRHIVGAISDIIGENMDNMENEIVTITDSIQQAQTLYLTAPARHYTEGLAKFNMVLTEDERELVAVNMKMHNNEPNLYGLSNAVSYSAWRGNGQRQPELEDYAGKILTMSPRDFRTLSGIAQTAEVREQTLNA